MMSGEGGKLLAGAAGFYSPWGASRRTVAIVSCAAISFRDAKRNASHRPPVPAFRLTPIRVREKRMNTLKTAKTAWSYQNINK
jgi:hypothetical protein